MTRVEWHRLFGLMLMDFFAGSPFEVELEKDLSLKQQLLDVIILRKLFGEFSIRLPDGLEDLADYNLVTFKSYQEVLDAWTIKELIGHYVNYRKQVSASMNDLLPENRFRLYAVCARFPQSLAELVQLSEVRPGVYNGPWGTDRVRIIVAGQLPNTEHNAILHLFSAAQERVQFGATHYTWRTSDTSSLVNRLFEAYRREGLQMPYTMQDFRREYVLDHLDDLTPEERMKGLPPQERMKGLPPNEVVKALPPEDLAKNLPEEVVQALPLKKRLEGLSAEQIEEYLRKLKAQEQGSPDDASPHP